MGAGSNTFSSHLTLTGSEGEAPRRRRQGGSGIGSPALREFWRLLPK